MALSKKSVNLAIKILRKVNPDLPRGIIMETKSKQPRVFGRDRKSDGGYESVYIYINNPTEAQLNLFESRKSEVPNTSFVRSLENNVVKLGWF